MLPEKYTRCPGCATVFRVSPDQLAVRGGQVRCGRCKAVFDGEKQAVALGQSRAQEASAPDARLPSAPAPAASADAVVTTGAGSTISPLVATDERPPEPTTEAQTETLAAAQEEAPPADGDDDLPGAPDTDRFSPVARRTTRRRRNIAYALATVVLAALIAGQAVFHYRDWIAAKWPSARPTLVRLCAVGGCAIRPLRDDAAMSDLSIDASDLQADPAHRGLLILTATLRNRAAWALAYPYIELTLTDAQDRVVVRRALAPSDYAPGTADLQAGIAPNAEVSVKVFIDASATAQAGYRLYMFYP
jgi:predicted Zn finger-like uncharacterized protein